MINLIETLQIISLSVTLIFMLFLWLGLRRERIISSSWRPTVTVLVAARNEERDLPGCLESLNKQDYPKDLCEFIIIDDGSTDATGEIAKEWSDKDARFRVIRLEDEQSRSLGPKKRALTKGFDASSGDVIICTDADSHFGLGWLSGMIACFDEKTTAVCGMVKFDPSRSFWGKLAAFEGLVDSILNAAVIGIGGALSCFGANFAYRRKVFNDAGGFDVGSGSLSGDDDLLLQRMRSSGGKIRFCANSQSVVMTQSPQDRRSYWNRKRRHLSAGKRYAFHWIMLALVVFIACLTTDLLAVLWFADYHSNLNFAYMWGFFSLALFIIFIRGKMIMLQEGYWIWSLTISLVFPLYFVVIQPLTLLPAPSWKGRSSKHE
ncbi:hypothetical protein CEE37_01240 [candidate division LCP-89 bacterium B3_LCP]|uniref:Glycosyltransferase 2-like domain-containing protein n=1 Tax=candidate division LCP-89 bacterium B3_LCP TaxID=2012998 RepID=A0A532V555_UNCL8|nr:MAG: hypothetical protein CEE37_01240 [candidate division LCP-89 bacterium B3_LCP]